MRHPLRNSLTIILVVLLLTLISVFIVGASGAWNKDWRTASRESAGIAPDPARTHEAVVQLYAARAFNWRGIFGVHTWIATKEAGAPAYVVYQVVGWRAYRNLPVRVVREDVPDRLWFDSRPRVLADLRGAVAERAIPGIKEAAESYPYPESYRLWPGPNSNTFTAYVARSRTGAAGGAALQRPRQGLSRRRTVPRPHPQQHRLAALRLRRSRCGAGGPGGA